MADYILGGGIADSAPDETPVQAASAEVAGETPALLSMAAGQLTSVYGSKTLAQAKALSGNALAFPTNSKNIVFAGKEYGQADEVNKLSEGTPFESLKGYMHAGKTNSVRLGEADYLRLENKWDYAAGASYTGDSWIQLEGKTARIGTSANGEVKIGLGVYDEEFTGARIGIGSSEIYLRNVGEDMERNGIIIGINGTITNKIPDSYQNFNVQAGNTRCLELNGDQGFIRSRSCGIELGAGGKLILNNSNRTELNGIVKFEPHFDYDDLHYNTGMVMTISDFVNIVSQGIPPERLYSMAWAGTPFVIKAQSQSYTDSNGKQWVATEESVQCIVNAKKLITSGNVMGGFVFNLFMPRNLIPTNVNVITARSWKIEVLLDLDEVTIREYGNV